MLYALWQLPDMRFHIYFLDVGQGDSIFIITPENHQILIDGGPDNKVLEELAKVMPFFDKSIDMLILTHPDLDHVGGLVELVKRIKVDNVMLTGIEMDSSTYFEFLKELTSQNVNIIFAEAKNDISFGEVFFDVLYPFENISGEDFDSVNNTSIAVKIYVADSKILLTGDLEIEGEQMLIDKHIDLSADIYKAGHHGSRSSSSLKFLQMVKPKIVVIQSGKDNKYDHPHIETIRNLYRMGIYSIYRNDEIGTIEFAL